ncbi:GNAT family N-acetyltransferase [Streptomyces sp. NRRL S-350]|uniref:GNAT family N-acetyltransferase n=1 Tax=Streptomyces sp. NRRL S-350 TaxID=1463902 RepID=UPI000A713E93|nr:GNAT family N-acetyltransferase [Streptomyces sp. NRRL S-350]
MTSADHAPNRPLLDEIERYYDAVPRSAARAEDFGPLTLFVREGTGWPYYARPTLGHDGPAATAEDVRRVLERQRELGAPEAFEWVAEQNPELRAAVEAAGLTVHEHPLLVLGPQDEPAPTPALPQRVEVRVLAPDAPELAAAVAVPHVAFGAPGTAVGEDGAVESARTAARLTAEGAVARVAERIAEGTTVQAAALDGGAVLCAGQYNPVGAVGEVVGVGTLPSARRRGLGLAVTAALVAHARSEGIRTVFLSASDEDVARIYRRAGFRPFATALIAEPASPRS